SLGTPKDRELGGYIDRLRHWDWTAYKYLRYYYLRYVDHPAETAHIPHLPQCH
ncbi:hypothetical protein AB1N83_012632, partial [Pleurotus pulmonarius]